MQWSGMYNFASSGTEVITGIANESQPSYVDLISTNANLFFSGQFTNLSRVLLGVELSGYLAGGQTSIHNHDLRAYESLNLQNIPMRQVGIYVPTGKTVGFHGMGSLTLVQDEDERAICLSKSMIWEDLHQSPAFELDVYNSTTTTTAATTTLWTPTSESTQGAYKITVAAAGAQTVELQWTNSAGGSADKIGLIRFGAAGTFVYDFDTALCRNPNGDDGLLQAITTTTASTQIDTIGHDILASQ